MPPDNSDLIAGAWLHTIPDADDESMIDLFKLRSAWTESRTISSRFSDIEDGLSNTILVIEQAARPTVYTSSGELEQGDQGIVTATGTGDDRPGLGPTSTLPLIAALLGGPVASSQGAWVTAESGVFRGVGANYHNYHDPFSFHDTISALFADGSVHSLHADTNPLVLSALYSRAGGEITEAGDW